MNGSSAFCPACTNPGFRKGIRIDGRGEVAFPDHI